MHKRILVTGAAGFIGFHLSQALKQRGDSVEGIDNFNAYYSPALKKERAALLERRGIPVTPLDLTDADALNNFVATYRPTHLVHLAAQAGVRHSIAHPHAFVQANIVGFLNILETCRRFPEIKLTYASSSSVYGLNTETPFAEKDRTDRQASFYGVTKKANELMASTYHHLYGVSATGLRFFTVYGPWGRPDMAYYSFAEAIQNGHPIAVYNHGNMRRDFTYIDDVVAGTVAAIDLEAPLEIFNLGNHRPETLIHFIRLIEQALNKKAILEFQPMQQGDVTETFADIQHSKERLGYEPRIPLEAGIPKFIDWFLSR